MADNPHIFIADDDYEDRLILLEFLREIHDEKNIRFAENGIDLLSQVDELLATDGAPALIVLDLNMPRMNGIETLGHLRLNPALQQTPIVILSTAVNQKQKDICMTLGATSYLSKPCSYDEARQMGNILTGILKAGLN